MMSPDQTRLPSLQPGPGLSLLGKDPASRGGRGAHGGYLTRPPRRREPTLDLLLGEHAPDSASVNQHQASLSSPAGPAGSAS